MLDSLNALSRLPGVLCETRLPHQVQQPLRLDIAGFVGFAERGPLDVPVLVEDFSQYQLIFGGDLPVARIEGRPLYAHLSRTVEIFFENGGKRCYVVRVAGEGRRPNQFHLPGLLQESGLGDWQPIPIAAAWSGRWSDLMSLATTIRLQPLTIRDNSGMLLLEGSALNTGDFTLPLRVADTNTVRPGDLLRLYARRTENDLAFVYMQVAAVEKEASLATDLLGTPLLVRPIPTTIRVFNATPDVFSPDQVEQLTTTGWQTRQFDAAPSWSRLETAYRLSLPVSADVNIDTGTLLRLSGSGGQPIVFFSVDKVQRRQDASTADTARLFLDSAQPLQWITGLNSTPYEITQVDVLSFDLLIREGEETLEIWRDLRFSPGPNYWQDRLTPEIDRRQIYPVAFSVDDYVGRSLLLGKVTLDPAALLLPIGMSAVAQFRGPTSDALSTGKDGLDRFDPVGLFVDPDFYTVGSRNLLTTANDLLHLTPHPRRLQGIHSLLLVDEVALIAVPDLAHVGWDRPVAPPLTEVVPPVEPPEPPSGFQDCPPPPLGVMDDGAMPVLKLNPAKALSPAASQAWLEDLPDQLPLTEYDERPVLEVQRALIRLCAARADMVTILALPQHYFGRTIDQWYENLTKTPDFFDGQPLSYAAVYHGWPAIRETTTPALAPLRYIPPDGAICGMMAAREIQRGTWIAPANVPLRTVIDLKPAFSDEAWQPLYQRQINIIRRKPGQYTLMSALTLARDRSLTQLSVRRLLIFLRKLALREGQRYVFETNNERFRTLVQSYFEQILSKILERGGVRAYQVVTNEEINTANDYDNGRFLIALKVAPTLPIEFITITMLRSGDVGLDILER